MVFKYFLCQVFIKVGERATGREVKVTDGKGAAKKLNKYYMQMTQCWWQKRERISNILSMVFRGRVTEWG